ncbi:MAG: M3 family oligoendopeptidase [bacterium]|nr:M3 family oligoendopeptidase [bacterium]
MKKTEMKWDLNNLIKAKEFSSEIKKAENAIQRFSKSIKQLTPNISGKKFAEIIKTYESAIELSLKIIVFTELFWTVNINDQKNFFFKSKAEDLELKLRDSELFFERWLMGLDAENLKILDEKNFKRLSEVLPGIKLYFKYLAEKKKYTLPLSEEKIINRKNINLKDPLLKIYEMILDSFEFKMKIGNSTKTIRTQDELLFYVKHSDPKLRESAYQALFKPYKENLNKIFTLYSAIVKDWYDDVKTRNFKSPISRRNFDNYIDDKVVDTLINVCTENRTVYQEYFKLKAKMLKMKKIQRYDIYAPLKKSDRRYSFSESKQIILDIFSEFNPEFKKKAELFFKEGHIDSHPRKNKISGAFCSPVNPKIVPYILLNFNGNIDSVMTAAHELGHGIHSLYSKHLSVLVQSEPLPLAETASTFCEMLLFEKMLKDNKDNDEKASLIFQKIADSYSTVMRQNYFVKFEKIAHQKIKEGINANELCEIYFSTLKEQFGDSMTIPEEFKYEWAYINHMFHTPFYCYAYNFGELLSMSIYALYKKEGKTFIPKLEKILSSGGSESTEIILKNIGIDIRKKSFWQGSFNLIKEWITQLKRLT